VIGLSIVLLVSTEFVIWDARRGERGYAPPPAPDPFDLRSRAV